MTPVSSRIALRQFELPDTENGLTPTECWHCVGNDGYGRIFAGGMDHHTNAALYLLEPGAETVRCIGDARNASQFAGNLVPGETFQKFHTRPLVHDGLVYVASLNYSGIDDGYKKERGSHLYRYDPNDASFRDLSALYSDGLASSASGIVALAGGNSNDWIVGVTAPDANLVLFDTKSSMKKFLGRPDTYDREHLYAGRVLWCGKDERIYFTAGNPYWGSYDDAVYNHVHYYDLKRGRFGERQDWRLHESRAIETCQWTHDRQKCLLVDDVGRIYVYDYQKTDFYELGILPCAPDERIWVFHLLEDMNAAFFISSTVNAKKSLPALYKFDFRTGKGSRICYLREIHPTFEDTDFFTGYDALDLQGRFYFTSFSSRSDQRLVLNCMDPRHL